MLVLNISIKSKLNCGEAHRCHIDKEILPSLHHGISFTNCTYVDLKACYG